MNAIVNDMEFNKQIKYLFNVKIDFLIKTASLILSEKTFWKMKKQYQNHI